MAGLEDAHAEAEDDDLADHNLVKARCEGGEEKTQPQNQGAQEGTEPGGVAGEMT